jgi:hypothetical protein
MKGSFFQPLGDRQLVVVVVLHKLLGNRSRVRDW